MAAGTALPSLPALASLLDPQRRPASPDEIKRRRALADALSEQAVRPDAGSLLGAIGKGLQGLTAAYHRGQADRDERAGQDEVAAALARIGQGGGASSPGGLPSLPGATPGMAAPVTPTRDRGGVPANIPSFVAAAGQPYGISPSYMTTVADIESRGNPNAANPSGAKGLYQFMPGTARGYGLSNPFDPAASADAAARLASDNRASLQRALGRAPTDAELYLAHQQGAGGAAKLLANPDARAADLVGTKAVVQNGGRADMSARAFSGLWTDKYDQRAGSRGRQADAGPAALADMPVAGAQPVSFLTEPRDPGGGFFIPPGDRAQAPAGDPSGPRPGDAPAPQANPDIAALLAREPMGAPQGFTPPAMPPVSAPAPIADAPLPPVRPSDADLQVAQAPQPQQVPLPPVRPSDAALAQPSPADLPAPGAVPAAGRLAIDPNSPDAGAGVFARRQGIDALLGGLQDGLDRVFGGPQTQARLDRQAAALGGAPQASPRALRYAEALANPGSPGGTPAPASPGPSREAVAAALSGGGQPDPRAQRIAAALDPAGAQVAAQMQAQGQPQQGQPVPQPMPQGYPQAGGLGSPQPQGAPQADARRADLLALANHPYASPQIRQYALDQLNPKLTIHDAGDALIATDPSGNLVRSYPKTKAADFGEVGRDAYGQPVMGYRNYGQQTVSVPQVPGVSAGQAPVDMAGKPIPAGVDPKVVREAQSKSYAGGTVPAEASAVAELRKEVAQRPEFKNYAQAVPVYRAMTDAAGRDSKASDLNLIYGLGKIMDPGSVVREGELKMANDTQGVSDKLIGMWNAVNGGARLTPQSRAALMAEAYGRMQAHEGEYRTAQAHYTDIARRNRMNPDDVVQGFEPVKPWQADGGTVSVATPEDARKLKPGTRFRTPDGREFTR